MTTISHITKRTDREVEGDWDTAIDYRESVITRNTIEFKVEGILCKFEITIIDSKEKSYCDNEETGGYGPDMQHWTANDEHSCCCRFVAGNNEGFSFDPDLDFLYKQLTALDDCETVHDLYVPMMHYMCVSNTSWESTLDSILNA